MKAQRMYMVIALLLMAVVSATAAPTTTGQLTPVAAPGSLAVGSFENSELFYLIQELSSQSVVTPFSGGLIGGMVPAGVPLDFYIIHSDPVQTQASSYIGSVTFDTPILGLYVGSSSLDALDPGMITLGSPISTYPTGVTDRGLETSQADSYILSNGNKTLTLRVSTGPSVDQVRVVVASAVPEPASVVLFGVGLIAVFGLKKLRGLSR